MSKPKKIPCNDGLLAYILLDLFGLEKAIKKIPKSKKKDDLLERVEDILEDYEAMVGKRFVTWAKKPISTDI